MGSGPISLEDARAAVLAAASPLPAADAGLPMLPPLMPPPVSPGSGWRKRKPHQYDDIEMGKELKGTVIRPPPSAG